MATHRTEAQLRFEELVGAWRLVSLDAIRPSGTATTGWLGAHPAGLLLYDGSGSMSVQIVSGPREEGREDSPSEVRYYAYFGAFELDAEAGTIVHHVHGSLLPDEVGIAYKQDFALTSDQLMLLTATHRVAGEERRNRILWHRVRKAAT